LRFLPRLGIASPDLGSAVRSGLEWVTIMPGRIALMGVVLTLAMSLASAQAFVRAEESGFPGEPAPEGATRLLYFSSHSDVTTPDAATRFAAVATAITLARKAHPDSHLILGGSLLGPSVLGSIDQGSHIIKILNTLAPDLMAVGKREFAYGTPRMLESATQADFPFLSTNMRLAGGPHPYVKQSVIINGSALDLGFLALTSPDAVVEYGADDVAMIDVNTVITTQASILRQAGADAVVLLADIDFPDLRYLERREVLDIIYYAHNTDNPYTLDHQGSLLNEGPRDGKLIVLDLWGEDFGIGGMQVRSRAQLLDLAAFEPSAQVMKLITGERKKLEQLMAAGIGTVQAPFSTGRDDVRSGENAFGNFIADALRTAMETDIAFINAGAIRGESRYGVGDTVTRSDIQRELPFANHAVGIKLSGARILEALEQSLACATVAEGCFLHASGLKVVYDSRESEGLRIRSVLIGGDPLERNRTYTVTVSDFLAHGNDHYSKFAGAVRVKRPASGRVFWDIVANHIAATGTLTPHLKGWLVDTAIPGADNPAR
jgi:2',3'-cyclic-nucleotide 2'-phosphodiesterase (5'-nucleotidase family)